MPTISRFYGIEIRMYFNEKHGPHFHAVYGEHKALIDVAAGKAIAGYLPPRALRLVLAWNTEHRRGLQENWNRARNGEPLLKIRPLE